MALATAAAAAPVCTGEDTPADLRYFVFALFFIFGGITSLNDVIIPKLKELFTLNYTQAMWSRWQPARSPTPPAVLP